MSASDSDNSIDWLASEEEEEGSVCELEPSKKKRSQRPPEESQGALARVPLSESDDKPAEEDAVRAGSPPSHTEPWGYSLRERGQPGTPRGKRAQNQKRQWSSGASEHREKHLASCALEKELLFANKCVELQCYIQPLSSILKGLRLGRYRERLSGFQESVAMDRIQRIMGVLQNPGVGERYVNILLQMENMLKSWFPNIQPKEQHTANQTDEAATSKKQKVICV